MQDLKPRPYVARCSCAANDGTADAYVGKEKCQGIQKLSFRSTFLRGESSEGLPSRSWTLQPCRMWRSLSSLHVGGVLTGDWVKGSRVGVGWQETVSEGHVLKSCTAGTVRGLFFAMEKYSSFCVSAVVLTLGGDEIEMECRAENR